MTLELPSGQQLVHVAVDGVPAQLARTGSRRWLVELLADGLPQQVDVVFGGTLTSEVVAPRLVDLSVQKTAWTLVGLGSFAAEVARDRTATPQTLGLARLESAVASLGDLADSQAADLPPVATANAWSVRRGRYAVQRALAAAADPQDQTEQLSNADRSVKLFREKLATAGIETADPPRQAPLDETPQPTEAEPIACLLIPGPAEKLPLAAEPVADQANDNRLALAAASLAALLGLWTCSTNRKLLGWLVEHAHFALALVGIGWLLAGPISWIGWLLVGLAVWLAWRSPWPQRTAEPLSSVVRRSSIHR